MDFMERRKQKNKTEEIEYTTGSGNVYSDFGFPNPEEAREKATSKERERCNNENSTE